MTLVLKVRQIKINAIVCHAEQKIEKHWYSLTFQFLIQYEKKREIEEARKKSREEKLIIAVSHEIQAHTQ